MILVTLTMDAAKMYYTKVEAMVDLIVIIPLKILAVFVGAINSNYKICSEIIAGLTAVKGIIYDSWKFGGGCE